MGAWFHERIIDTGRLPLFCFFVALVVGFGFIRLSVRLIRAQVKWWPGNVQPGGLHIHHVVFGVVFMVVGGVVGISIPDKELVWLSISSGIFGLGTALVLDEFALILHLEDVYWTEEGRTSVDAVFVAVALTGLLVLGVKPFGLDEVAVRTASGEIDRLSTDVALATIILINGGLAAITLIKGKLWTGLIGVFLPLLLIVGAIRLARPNSPWAHRRYKKRPRKEAKAQHRESRYRQPAMKAKDWLQDVIGGRPS
ncbi:MAG: hypothetical protein H0T78_11265 [Longispora sp.]|nr:hypothetical protein [Longispora sp. (in: high G+C Gram-positive bacteria)]